MKRTLLLVLLMALCATIVVADDGALAVEGGAVRLLEEHRDVRMISASNKQSRKPVRREM